MRLPTVAPQGMESCPWQEQDSLCDLPELHWALKSLAQLLTQRPVGKSSEYGALLQKMFRIPLHVYTHM